MSLSRGYCPCGMCPLSRSPSPLPSFPSNFPSLNALGHYKLNLTSFAIPVHVVSRGVDSTLPSPSCLSFSILAECWAYLQLRPLRFPRRGVDFVAVAAGEVQPSSTYLISASVDRPALGEFNSSC